MISQLRYPDLYGETLHPIQYHSILETLGEAFEKDTTWTTVQYERQMDWIQKNLINPDDYLD